MKDQTSPKLKIVPEGDAIISGFRFRCPFCGGRATIGTTRAGYPGVDHTVPFCRQFDTLDPTEFARAVRIELTRTAPS